MEPGADRARRPVSARGPEASTKSDTIATIVALLAHAAVIAIAWPFAAGTKAIVPPDEAPSPAATALIEIDLHEPEAPPPPEEKPPEAEPEHREGAHGDGREAALRDVRPTPPHPPAPESSASASAAPNVPVAPTPSAAPAADEYGVAPAVPMPGGDALSGSPAWTVPGVLPSGSDATGGGGPAKPDAPVGPRASVAPGRGALLLRDALTAHDRDLGLGNPGGTAVANAVAEAVRGASLPKDATAVLVARVGGDGVVQSVSVQRFSAGDVQGWNGVASAASAAIGKKRLGLAGLGPKGAIVQIRVTSAFTYPSGSRDGAETTHPHLIDGPPRDVMPAPSPDGDACAPERHSDLPPLCGVGMVVGRFDVTDLATRKHRYVHASAQVKLLDDGLSPSAQTPAAAPAAPAPSTSPSSPPPATTAGAPR